MIGIFYVIIEEQTFLEQQICGTCSMPHKKLHNPYFSLVQSCVPYLRMS